MIYDIHVQDKTVTRVIVSLWSIEVHSSFTIGLIHQFQSFRATCHGKKDHM